MAGPALMSRAAVMPDGSFALRGVPEGQYELQLRDGQDSLIARQAVRLRGLADPVFRVAAQETGTAPGHAVSLRSLQHPPAASARRELSRARRAAQQGNLEESKKRLRKALIIDPGYSEAHNDLGVALMLERAYTDAGAEFSRAVELEPGAARAHANLALAWYALGRTGDAEKEARKALATDPQLAAAQGVLDYISAHDAARAAKELFTR